MLDQEKSDIKAVQHNGVSREYPKTYTGRSYGDVDHIVNADGQYLLCRYWIPDGDITAIMFHLHGYAEHSGRSNELAERLKELGVFSLSHDHVGHGESQGLRGHCTDYNVYIRDLWQHLDKVKTKYPDVPVFLYGHSMGGGIAIIAAQQKPKYFRGILLSAPFIQPSPETATPFKLFLARTIVHIMPKLRVGKLDVDFLSSDKDQVKAYVEDELNDINGMRASIAVQFLAMADKMKEIMSDVEWPFILAHSEKDQICSIGGSKILYEVSKSKDKTMKIYDGPLHMLEHEKPALTKAYFDDVFAWLKERI